VPIPIPAIVGLVMLKIHPLELADPWPDEETKAIETTD